MPQSIALILLRTAGWAGDQVARSTGLVAVPIPLERAHGRHAVTLALPGYIQTNSYGCGGVAAAMAARYLRPELAFGTVYDAINPVPDNGAGTRRVVSGLRACGVRVSVRTNLTFRTLAHSIDKNWPVLVVIHNPGSESHHWVVVYGYSRRPGYVYIATNGLPFITGNRIDRVQFEKLWAPNGNGLVCQRAKRVMRQRRVHGSK